VPNNYNFGGFDPYMKRYIRRTPKRHIFVWKDVMWHVDCQNRSLGVTCACDRDIKQTKKETYSGKLGIHPDHPRHPIEIPFPSLNMKLLVQHVVLVILMNLLMITAYIINIFQLSGTACCKSMEFSFTRRWI